MIEIQKTTDLTSHVYQDALSIRKEVFVEEQQVPLELEIENEDVTIHFVLYDNGRPEATVRLYPKSKDTFKVQRMAVLKEARKKGYGRDIMAAAESYAVQEGKQFTLLGAQTQAIPFYESLGYQAFGEEYLDAGIQHFDMKKTL